MSRRHEIESYDPTTGKIAIWVKFPTLSGSTDTAFSLYYGNSSITASAEDPAALWAGYEAVYHDGTYADSANGHDATTNTAVSGTGEIAGGGVFNGSTSARLASIPDSGSALDAKADYTVSMWLKPQELNRYQVTAIKKHSGAPWLSWYTVLDAQNKFALVLNDTNANAHSTWWNANATAGSWYHVAGIKSGSALSMVVNGATNLSVGGTITNQVDADSVLQIGRDTAANAYSGTIDEFRIAKTNLSADWLKTEYQNGLQQGTGSGKFLKAISAPETAPAPTGQTVTASSP